MGNSLGPGPLVRGSLGSVRRDPVTGPWRIEHGQRLANHGSRTRDRPAIRSGQGARPTGRPVALRNLIALVRTYIEHEMQSVGVGSLRRPGRPLVARFCRNLSKSDEISPCGQMSRTVEPGRSPRGCWVCGARSHSRRVGIGGERPTSSSSTPNDPNDPRSPRARPRKNGQFKGCNG